VVLCGAASVNMATMAVMEQPAQQLQLDEKQQEQQLVQADETLHQQPPTQQFEESKWQQEQRQQHQQQQTGDGQQQKQAQQQPEQDALIEEQLQEQQQLPAPPQPQPLCEPEQQLPLDVYGFSLAGLTEQQLAARAACDAYEARRRAKWQPYADKQQLPEGAVLKRYCRKVRCRAELRCREKCIMGSLPTVVGVGWKRLMLGGCCLPAPSGLRDQRYSTIAL
jgi:hypothetical protein